MLWRKSAIWTNTSSFIGKMLTYAAVCARKVGKWFTSLRLLFFNHVGGSSRKRPIRSILEFHKSCYRPFVKHNSSSLSFLNPFVIGALALQLIFVIFVDGLVACSSFLRGPLSSKVAALIDPWVKDYRATSGDN